MRGIPWRLLGAAVATAVLLDLAFPVAGPASKYSAWGAWIALLPLLIGLVRFTAESRRRRGVLGWSFLAGWLCGAVWFGANCYWVFDTMHLYGGMDEPMAAVALVAFSLYLGFWFGVFGLFLGLVRVATLTRGGKSRGPGWLALAVTPFLWVSMEFALARVPGFPWDLLGYSQVDNGLLMRLAPWTGVWGISFVVAVVNALLAAGWLSVKVESQVQRRRLDPRTYWYGLLVACWIGFVLSGSYLFEPPKPATEATAMLVQPNLDVAGDSAWTDAEWERQITQFSRLAGEECGSFLAGMPEVGAAEVKPDCGVVQAPVLVAWPESPAPFRDKDPRFEQAMKLMAVAGHAPMVVGAIGMDEDPAGQRVLIYNSAVVIQKDGRAVGRYDKMHLVPFGEYVPFRRVLFFIRQVAQSMTDMSTGSERKVFRLNGHRFGTFICYEAVFGDEVREFAGLGAEVLVNISDDGWYGDTSAPWQHLNMARMRAAENRRWILRDTNNGVTAAIDPYGVVRQSIPRHQVGVLAAKFGYGSEVTFYTMHGDWLAEVCAAVALMLFVWAARVIVRR